VDPIPFGKYLLSERIAEGGMAVVYRAKLTGPGGFEKTLVVKQIRAELAARAEFVELFVKEAKTTVQLTHANIVPVFELGMLDDTYFLALELVDGPPLATLIERGAFPVPLAAYVAEQVLRGLDYAHRRDIVHRDLSPANVLCSRDGEVKIVDFGIAAEVRGRAIVGGSRGYVAPEQAAGDQVDARADLYSVGVLLWEMLAGKKREAGATIDAPAPLLEIVNRALADKPDARFPTAAAMLQPLTRFLRDTEGSTQAELADLVRKRAPDVKRSEPIEASDEDRSGPRTRPMTRGEATPALGTRAHKEVTFATRFIEGEPASPAPSQQPSLAPVPSLVPAPPPERSRVWLPLGALALVAVSAYGGARLRDTVGTAQPIPVVRPAAAVATLRVTLDPNDARLAVDGADAITLPHDAAGAILLSPGAHTLSATALARPTLEQPITLTPGEARALRLTLAAEEGRVELDSEPSGAEVKLGDRSLGTTPTTISLPLDGPHKLRFEHKDYLAAERVLRPDELTGGPPRSIKIAQRLEPLPRGQLTIGARPWAHVTIDGDRKPDTPIVKLAVSAGPHTVRVACPATGKELKFVVQVEAGRETRRVADLTGGEPRLIE
jgi:serine/threonine-protein kinase